MNLDLVIIASARSELLEQTLNSFQKMVFTNFEFNNVSLNIDPFYVKGGQIFRVENAEVNAERDRVEAVARKYFKNLNVFRPQSSNFTKASGSLWQQTSADYVFLLEDDWIALSEITPDMVFHHFNDPSIKELSIMNANKNWNGKQSFHCKRSRPWYLPFRVTNENAPIFSTSPSFWDGDFLRDCAELLDERYDPEKQFYSGVNLALEERVKPFKNKFLVGEVQPNLIQDIGREWQLDSGIQKLVIEGESLWRSIDD